jgi:hypothetical protein
MMAIEFWILKTLSIKEKIKVERTSSEFTIKFDCEDNLKDCIEDMA